MPRPCRCEGFQMADAARRAGNGLGTDVARRLIARPIRLHGSPSGSIARRETAPGPDAVETAPSADLTRSLETQILVMKAVLKAERHENAKLRATFAADEESLGAEARAVRDRWAGLVDRILNAPR